MSTNAVTKRPWIAVAVMTLAALMDMVDGSIVNVALPTISTELHASSTALEWIVSGYMLTFAAALIIAGRIGDRFGRRRMFLLGVVAFGVTSLLSGLSNSAGQLAVYRLLQGAAAAILIPQVLATFRSMFTGKNRAAAFGMYGAVAGLAAAVGVILGGVLTQANIFGMGWRAIFFVNVPIALITAVVAAIVVPETKKEDAGRLDWAGALVLAGGLGAIVYPLLEGRQKGWPLGYFVLMAAGVAAIVLLGRLEKRRERSGILPLLHAEQFTIPAFMAGLLVQFFFSVALQGFSIIFILWLQLGHHYSPLHAGLTLIPFSIGAILTAPGAGNFALKYGNKVLMAGAALMVVGTALTAAPVWFVHGEHLSAWLFAPGFVLAGAGLGLLVVPLINVVLAAIPSQVAGGASGVFSTAQQLGGAIGVAVIGSMFFSHLANGDFSHAFAVAVPLAIGAYVLSGVMTAFLPKTAVSEEAALEVE